MLSKRNVTMSVLRYAMESQDFCSPFPGDAII